MQVWNVLRAARWKYRMQKSCQKSHLGTIAQLLSGYIFATKAGIDNRKRNLLSNNISSTCPHNMANFSPLAAEYLSLVCGTPGNLNGFCVLEALLHGTLVVGVSRTLRHWTEDATYIQQGGHQVGHISSYVHNTQVICPVKNLLIYSSNSVLWTLASQSDSTTERWLTNANWKQLCRRDRQTSSSNNLAA